MERLETLGFEWDPWTALWEKMFSELVRFKDEHGHCKVPIMGWSENPELRTWVSSQRSKRGKLSPDRVERLEALGFEWDPIVAAWENRFSELVRFKEEQGHCNVPMGWIEGSELGNWTNNQRQLYRRRMLSTDRVERLEALGFKWRPRAESWETMFSELVQFKEKHGHCEVPRVDSRVAAVSSSAAAAGRRYGKPREATHAQYKRRSGSIFVCVR